MFRIVGLGHSGNSTALDLLSAFVATAPAAAGVHIAELLRNAHETHRMLANLRTQNEELRVQVREQDNQLQHVTFLNSSASQPTPVAKREQEMPTRVGRPLALALIIGILVGIIVMMLFVHRR